MARKLAGLLAAALLPAAAAAAPPPGRYDARLCVTVAAAPAPDCGPAQVEVLRDSRLRVRISDIVYHLELRSSQLEVVLMHGTMQIDEFVAPYDWAGDALQFADLAKRTRYELQLPRR